MTALIFESQISSSQQRLYDYHASGVALERLTPPWDSVRIRKWLGGEATRHLSEAQQFGDISKGRKSTGSLSRTNPS